MQHQRIVGAQGLAPSICTINHQIIMTVELTFLPDAITVQAEAGESVLEAAQRAGVEIPTGCLRGSCHACEVEIDDGETICACITSVPLGKKQVIVTLYSDPTW